MYFTRYCIVRQNSVSAYQSVVETDISLKACFTIRELDNWHFCSGDGDDVVELPSLHQFLGHGLNCVHYIYVLKSHVMEHFRSNSVCYEAYMSYQGRKHSNS